MMRLLQSGMAKSGNYWLYSILQSILRHANLPTHTYIEGQPIFPIAREWPLSYPEQSAIDTIDITDAGVFFRISSVFRWPIDDMDRYLERATHVWTHSTIAARTDDVFARFDKIIYIVRDPRDVALSTARFMFTRYMKQFYPHHFPTPEAYLDRTLDKLVSHWRQHVTGHLASAQRHNIHIVFYERLLADLSGELEALCRYLNVQANAALVDAVQRDVHFENMREQSPGHVSKGKARQWVGQLSDTQNARVLRQAGSLLTLLGYPLHADQSDLTTPRLPPSISPEQITRAAAPPQTFKGAVKRIVRRVLG